MEVSQWPLAPTLLYHTYIKYLGKLNTALILCIHLDICIGETILGSGGVGFADATKFGQNRMALSSRRQLIVHINNIRQGSNECDSLNSPNQMRCGLQSVIA